MVTSLFSRHFNSQQESSETGPQEMVTNSPRGHIEMSVFTFIFNFVLIMMVWKQIIAMHTFSYVGLLRIYFCFVMNKGRKIKNTLKSK